MHMRSVFIDVDYVPMPPVKGHTHGQSAATRSSASLLIDNIGAVAGRRVVYYQGSKADERNDRVISRSHFWAKDQYVKPRAFAPEGGDLVAMVDVDYYVDMPTFLAKNHRAMLLYTFQPSRVAREDGEYKYTFDGDDNVVYTVSGGGAYRHPVWNYAGDVVTVYRKAFGCIPYSYSTFALERRQLDDDHQLILLTPLSKHYWFSAFIAQRQLAGNQLERLKVNVGNGFTRMTVNSAEGLIVHTGRAGAYSTSATAASVDDAFASVARGSKVGLTIPTMKGKNVREGVELLYEYHTHALKRGGVVPGSLVSTAAVRSYQHVRTMDEYDPEAKPSMVAFMQPLVDGAFAPAMTAANERRSIDARVLKVKDCTQPTAFVTRTIREFAGLFKAGVAEPLHPVGEDEIRARQPKPSQQRILDAAETEEANEVTKTFMKRECYQTASDPRNISTINGVHKRNYSAYMYAFADALKQFDWYAFGKTPVEIATRVSQVAEGCQAHVIETDFSRMDGRVGPVARLLEQVVAAEVFPSQYHSELYELMRSQQNLKGRGRFGTTYDTGTSRASGSPETSCFNTLLNAYTAYLSWRMSVDVSTGAFHTPAAAWGRLGIYAGDDGLTADIDPDVYVRAATAVGQRLTSEVKAKGETGIKFLARQYGPAVWFGCNNSVCDFSRSMSKFHATVTMPDNVRPEAKLMDKAYAMWLTDRNSFVYGKFLDGVVSHKPKEFKFRNLAGQWRITEDDTQQYPNADEPWVEELFRKQLPEFNVDKFVEWIEGCKCVEDFMDPPRFMERVPLEAKSLVVEGDEVCSPPPKPEGEDDDRATIPVQIPVVDKQPGEATTQDAKEKPGKGKPFRARKPKSERPSRQEATGGKTFVTTKGKAVKIVGKSNKVKESG